MIKEAIILAGGLGTRLRSVVSELPKCMAPVAGKPFLDYLVRYFQQQGIERFIFSVGYKYRLIEAWLAEAYPHLDYTLAIEEEPMGTGGGIRLACEQVLGDNVIVSNGDTLFLASLDKLSAMHQQKEAACTLSLKPMQQFDRYGVVELAADGQIASFKEKRFYDQGLINGGIYALNRASFLRETIPGVFSFEKDYLEKKAPRFLPPPVPVSRTGKNETEHKNTKLFGLIQDQYFIDIGIPEDFEKAQTELPALQQ